MRAAILILFLLPSWVQQVSAHSVARLWNEEILAAIRIDRPNPPVHARNLFHLAVCMYDAWAAYDSVAIGYLHHERISADDIQAERKRSVSSGTAANRQRYAAWRPLPITKADIEGERTLAISYAAYRLLTWRYARSLGWDSTEAALERRFRALGGRLELTHLIEGNSAPAVGNRIAAKVIAWGMADDSNEIAGYADPTYVNPQEPLIVLLNGIAQGGLPPETDPNRWQPLAFDSAEAQNGTNADLLQRFVGVTWLRTLPFSLQRTDPTLPWIDLWSGPPRLRAESDALYKAGALDVLRASSQLGSNRMIDISPGAIGNNPLGTDAGTGRPVNPYTRRAYSPNRVKLGDFARVLAEFWADGPHSETPPGHWHVLANQISDSPLTVKMLQGVGTVMNRLEWDVKLYFVLSAATHDAACAAWSMKRFYEGPRPITMIRYMASKGQSSDPNQLSYHPDGLPLELGVCEVITAESSAPGQRHFGVGSIGEIAVYSWPGEPANRATQVSPIRWMRALDWVPYQRKTFNNPAFPGYVSGHSTFSRAAAEVLTAFTGSPYFPAGLGSFLARRNAYLVFEDGPSQNVALQWATYFDAADQAGLSRRFGGIHVIEDDLHGRIIGSEAGRAAFTLARQYWDGTILGGSISPAIEALPGGMVRITWSTRRGIYYRVEWSADGGTWVELAPAIQARETVAIVTAAVPTSGDIQYSVVWQPAPF